MITIASDRGYYRLYINKKSFNNIFSEQKKLIVTLLNNYINSINYYKGLQIPYSIKFLFYGKPGTGKTSFINAIANYLDRKILYLKNSELDRDSITEVNNNDLVICLDEIDRNINTKNKEDSKDITDIMNLIDGMLSPMSGVFVATTNNIDSLDPALLSRFHCIEITDINKDTAIEMVKHFKKSPEDVLKGETFPINPRYLQNKMLDM